MLQGLNEFIQKQAISSPLCCHLDNSLETYLLACLFLTLPHQMYVVFLLFVSETIQPLNLFAN